MSNPYEETARLKKAYKIADQLQASFAKVDTDLPLSEVMEVANIEVWHAAARKAGTNKPGEDTRQLVIHILQGREKAAHPDYDVFDDLAKSQGRDLDKPLTERAKDKVHEMKASGHRVRSGR